ncbi:S8 family serine peptidase [Paenibacillus sp. CF384]|uniref:S8 family serine peptidase n=1 Tax=Paenibacillus sp. CF384 TaxID=1884382 RepID=UPI000897B702|nr:S8 family serine peptidase [Paenibacillus sp. CF384]SDW65533.1 S-layer homology domain-containing protein [Paenibacillus sp. CF384]
MSFKRLIKTTSVSLCSTLLATLLLQQVASAQSLSATTINPNLIHFNSQSSILPATLSPKSTALKPAFISPKLQTNSSAVTRVIVQLSSQPTAAGQFAAKSGNNSLAAESSESSLRAEQSGFISTALSKGINLKVNYRFTTVLNGMEVSVPANQIPQLAKLPGVLSVFENRTYTSIPVMEPEAAEEATPYDINPIHQIGADAAWAKELTGKGLKVGVIDTGVDYLHPDLAGAYKGGYDSANGDDDPYEDYEDNGLVASEHGTHVSGTIVGRAANTTSSVVQKGIAYESDLYVYKVLSADASGNATGSTATVIDGIEHAVKDGMDVINMSLGADGDLDPNSPDAIAVNNAVLAGIVVVIANGNAGDYGYYTMGTPASSQLGISVGAADSPGSRFAADAVSSLSSTSYELHAMSWRTAEENFDVTLGAGPLDAVYVGLGADGDYSGKDVTGKVVVISRGTLAFVDKIAIAKSHGAKAAVIFNGIATEDDDTVADLSESITDRDGYIGEDGFLGDSFDFIPTYDMSGAEGRALARAILADNGATQLTLTFSGFESAMASGDHMVSFSSRGPNSDGMYGIKPDFAAPGNSIMSTWPEYAKYDPDASYEEAYNRISGTSMATPHVAGLALLLLQKHPDWTPFDVRSALANTADTLYDQDGAQYDVYTQGAGRVNVAKAIETPALLQTIDELTIYDKNLQPVQVTNYGDSASFGLMQAGDEAATEQLQLKNTSNAEVTYHASIKMHEVDSYLDTPDPSAIDVQLTGLTDEVVTASANSATPFALTLAPHADAAEGIYEGEVVLESAGLPTMHLPFVVHVGEQTPDNGYGVQDVELSPKVISPPFEGINGVPETMKLSFDLRAPDAYGIDVRVYNLDEQFIGYLMLYTNADEAGNLVPLEPDLYEVTDLTTTYLAVDEKGNIKFDDQDEPVFGQLADGTYRLEIAAPVLGKDGKPLVDENNIGYAYSTVTTFAVHAYGALVQAAEGNFAATASNKTVLNQAVLTFPVTEGVTYQVTKSSDTTLIDDAGVLKALPDSLKTVDLTVTIASEIMPEVNTSKTVSIELDRPYYGSGGGFIPSTPTIPNDSPSITKLLEQGQHASFLNASSSQTGTTVKVTITDDGLKKALQEASPAPAALVLKVNVDEKQQAVLELTPAQLKLLAGAPAGSTVILTTGSSSISLPVSLFSNLSADASVRVTIAADGTAADAFKAENSGAVVVGTPISFEVDIVTNKGATPLSVPITTTIKRSFTVTGSNSVNRLGVLFEENGSFFPAPAASEKHTDGTVTVVVSRPGLSTYAAAYRNTAFADIKFSWAQSAIQALADTFLLNGTTPTTFAPKQQVTRAEFAVMLARALGLQSSDAKAAFADVSQDAWYAGGVAAAVEAGLVKGDSQGLFQPNAPISRQDLSVILARALKLLQVAAPTLPPHVAYHDKADIAAYASDSIDLVTNNGLMKGINVNGVANFQPTVSVTRETAASVIYSLLREAKLIN